MEKRTLLLDEEETFLFFSLGGEAESERESKRGRRMSSDTEKRANEKLFKLFCHSSVRGQLALLLHPFTPLTIQPEWNYDNTVFYDGKKCSIVILNVPLVPSEWRKGGKFLSSRSTFRGALSPHKKRFDGGGARSKKRGI